MSNYVWNKILCDKATLDSYLIDYDPFGDGNLLVAPYITFNRMFGVESLDKYLKDIGTNISYGEGFSYKRQDDNKYEVMFCTKWKYPIEAIKKLLMLSHNVEWYAVEENCIYVSKFYWENGVREDVMVIEEGYHEWANMHMDFCDSLEDPDCAVWHYLQSSKDRWQRWESVDNYKRYEESAVNVLMPFGGITE